MCTWPLLARNKVEDSKINLPVQRYAESAEDEKMKAVAQKVCLNICIHTCRISRLVHSC